MKALSIKKLLNDPKHEVRALSWKQPYAQLMLHGKIETRTWDTKYRGLVLICASKGEYSGNQIYDISGRGLSHKVYSAVYPNERYRRPLGKAIAIGRLVDSRPMTKEDEVACYVQYNEPWQTRAKNGTLKTVQRWCHVYEDVVPIEQFNWNGVQGWKILDDKIKSKIKFLELNINQG